MASRGLSIAFGTANSVAAALAALGVSSLPDRSLVVDAPTAIIVVLLATSGAGLVFGAGWSGACARVAAVATLVVGLALMLALALSAGYLAGVYGPVGRGGAVIFTLVLALAFPYLVALPALELYCLRDRAPEPKPRDGEAS